MFQQPKHISQLITEVVVYYHRVELLTQQRVASNLCMRPNPDNLYQLTKIQTASKCSKPPGSPSSCNIPPPPGGAYSTLSGLEPLQKNPPRAYFPPTNVVISQDIPPKMLCLFYLSTFFLPIYASLTILSFFLHHPPPSRFSLLHFGCILKSKLLCK